MSPDKYARTFDQLRALVKRKYRGTSTRIDFQKPPGRERDFVIFAKRPAHDNRPDGRAIDDALGRCGLRGLGDRWKAPAARGPSSLSPLGGEGTGGGEGAALCQCFAPPSAAFWASRADLMPCASWRAGPTPQ